MATSNIDFLLLLLAFPVAISGAATIVGGSTGWSLNYNYTAWASNQSFPVGTQLVFKFDTSSHEVSEVTQTDYDNCNSANAINTYKSSPTTISLTSPGTRHFLCPIPTHCSRGMKVAIAVTKVNGGYPSQAPANSGHVAPPAAAPSGGSRSAITMGSGLVTAVISIFFTALLGF